MGGEEEDNLVAGFCRVGGQLVLDVFDEGGDEAWVRRPPVDHAPGYRAGGLHLSACAGAFEPVAPFPKLVQGAPGRGARVLRILGEGDCAAAVAATEAVVEEVFVHFFCQRCGVAEGDVGFVRSCLGGYLVEDLAHLRALML